MGPFDENGNAAPELLSALDASLGTVSKEPGCEILKFFKAGHLKPDLQQISSQFGALALLIIADIKPSAERSVALRKLLESKDAAVRAAL